MYEEPEVDHKWKRYFLNRKIRPTILFLAVAFVYNAYGYFMANSPISCMHFWMGDTPWQRVMIHIIKIIIYIGPPAATLFFYHSTLPHFRRQTPTNPLQ